MAQLVQHVITHPAERPWLTFGVTYLKLKSNNTHEPKNYSRKITGPTTKQNIEHEELNRSDKNRKHRHRGYE